MVSTKILLVEDSDTQAVIIKSYLESDEVTVLHAPTLAQALPLVKQADVLVVDLTLPDSSIEKTIQHLVVENSKPVLILSGTTDTELAHQLGRLGVLGSYLVKPTTKEQLAVSIAWAFGLFKRLQDRNERIEKILADKKDVD